jgi:hypothetical protein
MAARYWVGGTGTWDNLALLKWSTTSGGLGGSAVPTSADDVFFDANSGANTVTIGAGTAICDSLTMTGFTGTLAFGTNSIDLTGTGTTYVGATTFTATGTPLINITGTGTLTVTAGAVTEANSISFTINNAASNSVGVTGNVRNLTFAGTYTGALSNQTRTIYGNLTLKTGMTVNGGGNGTTFAATSGTQTITSAGLTLDFSISLTGTAIYQLADNLSMGTTSGRNFTLTSGTLDLNDKTLTIGSAFSSTNTNTRSVLFGTTGNITLTGIGTATIFNIATATNFSITGTPTINVTGNAVAGGTRRLDYGNTALPASPEANSLSFYITAGADSIQITSTAPTRNLDFTGSFTGSLVNSSRSIYGNYTLNSSMTVAAGTLTTSFLATSGTQLITSAGVNLNFPITINAPNATVQLQDALLVGTTTGRTITLTSGTFNLNNNNVTIFGSFVGTGSTTRTIAFGTGQFYLSGTSGSIWSVSGTNLTITGTSPTVNATANATTGERTVVHVPTTVSQALSISLNVTAGSSRIGFATGEQVFNNLNFTGFSGQIGNAGQSGNARFTIYGNLTMGAGMTCVGGASEHNFRGTGTQLITSNGVIFDQPIGLSGTGTYSLQDAFVTGSTRLITLTTGTLQTNGYSLTSGTFSFGGSGTKTLTFTNSTVTITGGSSTTGFTGSLTNTTLNLTGNVIVFTTAGTALLNAGGNGTVPAVTMGGTGQLIIGQSGTAPTVTTLSNTVSPCTISLLSTIGQLNVTNFNLSGTAGNLVTLNSSVAGTARTISKSSGTVNAYYLNIQDSTASGGAVWNAQFSTDAGNNTGWTFSTIFTGDVSEAFSILDIINVLSAFTTSATEPVTVADTLDTTAAFISNTTEPITLADTPSTTATFATVITENASFADITSSLAAFAAAIVEAANLADSSIVIRIHNSDLTEAITLDDSQTVIADFVDVVFEDINIEDFPTVEASFLAVITEDTNLAAFQAVAATFAASLAEAITSADASIGIRIHNSAATEIITLDNAQTALRTQYALIVENLVPADAPTVIASFNSQITENLVLLDSPFPRGWYAINDGQTVTWTKVNNSYP